MSDDFPGGDHLTTSLPVYHGGFDHARVRSPESFNLVASPESLKAEAKPGAEFVL
jgi:hypothetical protein